jgi:hypothetical protein
MLEDSSDEVRMEAARVLAVLAEKGFQKARVGQSLAKLARDSSRGVRIVATRALAGLGSEAPKSAVEALPRAFDQGDEAEKLAVLDAATQIGAGELVQMAIADPSPLVRIAAIDTAIGTQGDVAATLNAALADPATAVRRAALERLAAGKHGMGASDVDAALSLAIRDSDPAISDLALTTLARLGDPGQVAERLQQALGQRSENIRAQAATACIGLVQHDPKKAIELLEPLLEDPSHDVRVAALGSLATAYASSVAPDELSARLKNSEKRANRRLVLTAAFLVLAQTDAEGSKSRLEAIASGGPPFARQNAQLGLGLLASSADGIDFLKELVP